MGAPSYVSHLPPRGREYDALVGPRFAGSPTPGSSWQASKANFEPSCQCRARWASLRVRVLPSPLSYPARLARDPDENLSPYSRFAGVGSYKTPGVRPPICTSQGPGGGPTRTPEPTTELGPGNGESTLDSRLTRARGVPAASGPCPSDTPSLGSLPPSQWWQCAAHPEGCHHARRRLCTFGVSRVISTWGSRFDSEPA